MSGSLRSSPASSPIKRPRLTSPLKLVTNGGEANSGNSSREPLSSQRDTLSGSSTRDAVSGSSARDLLSGALNEALKSRSHKGDSAARHATSGRQTSGDQNNSPAKGSYRRRRRKDDDKSDYHHTFVMKLFDKSVDLAQFNQTNSLYPVCRAWMRNEPSNTGQAPRQRSPTPQPEDLSDPDEEEEERDDYYSLPPPDLPHNDAKCPRIPDVPRVELEGVDLEVNSATNNTPPAVLLSNHMVRWWEVRKSWKKTAFQNEKRFQKSVDILQQMFDDS